MPPAAARRQYAPSVQFARQITLGNEAFRHKLSNGRGQSSGAGVAASLATVVPCRRRRLNDVRPLTCSIELSWPEFMLFQDDSSVLKRGSPRS